MFGYTLLDVANTAATTSATTSAKVAATSATSANTFILERVLVLRHLVHLSFFFFDAEDLRVIIL